MNRIRPIKIELLIIFMMIAAIGKSQPIISQPENLPFKTTIPSAGALSHQFSAFIVGEKPIALNNISFSAINKTAAKKMTVSVYKGLINGNNATLLNKLSSAVVSIEAANEFKTFSASFPGNIMLDSWGVYYIVLHTEAEGEVTVAMASNIGAVKGNGVTVLSGVFNQDIPVTGNVKGLVDNNAFIGVSLNGPANAQQIAPIVPSYNLQRFSGTVQRGRALLQWKIENARNLKSSVLEKSSNQTDFTTVSNATTETTVNYLDGITGKAYYRLKFTDADGKISYSKTIALESKIFFNAKLLQTQLNKGENVRVEISASDAMSSLVTVVNRFGQSVKKITQQIIPGYNNIQFSTADLAPGNYYVKCSGGSANEFNSEIQMIVL